MKLAARAAVPDYNTMPGESEWRLRSVFEASAIGMATFDLSGRLLESNPALARMLGGSVENWSALQARGLSQDETGKNEAMAQNAAIFCELLRGERDSYEFERRFGGAGGSPIWGHLRAALIRDRSGHPAFVTAMLEDITGRKRAEEQLREAEKLEVIGRLAGGIAHDFNNLLTGILLYCDLMLSGLDANDPLRAHVNEIRMAGEQGAALTQQLLAIARKQVLKPRPILLNDVIASTRDLLRRLIGEPIELVTTLAPDLGTIVADPAQLRQILLNLVLNARDAIAETGTITIRTRTGTLPGSGQPAVVLVLSDTGCGMDAQTRARLFEPFFTTKQQGHGTGLGLATVQRIVTENGGAITVESEPGRGTQIEVFLPEMQTIRAVPDQLPDKGSDPEGDLPC